MKEQHYYRLAALTWLVVALQCKTLHYDFGYYLAFFMLVANTVFIFTADEDKTVEPTFTRTTVTDKYGNTESETTVTNGMVSK
jgi:hypothetical protein